MSLTKHRFFFSVIPDIGYRESILSPLRMDPRSPPAGMTEGSGAKRKHRGFGNMD